MKAFVFSSLILSFLLTSCTSLNIAKKEDVAQVRTSVSEEIIELKNETNSLNGSLQELQYKINKISQSQGQQSQEVNAAISDVKKQIANVKTEIQSLEKRQKEDKKALENKLNVVVEEVTKENRELRRQIESLRKTTVYTGTEGYHVVAEGDTLSKIAQAYGVSIKNLMEANGITDPNNIRVGQKLIIP